MTDFVTIDFRALSQFEGPIGDHGPEAGSIVWSKYIHRMRENKVIKGAAGKNNKTAEITDFCIDQCMRAQSSPASPMMTIKAKP
jgi:hypothetical protein